MLGGDERSELVEIVLDQVAEAEEHAGANMRRRCGPAGKGLEGGVDRRIDLTRAAECEASADFARGGIEYVGLAPGREGRRAAVDDVIDKRKLSQGKLLKV